MSLARSSTTAAGSIARFRGAVSQASTAVRQLQTSTAGANPALDKIRAGSDKLNTSLGRLKTSATGSGGGLGKIKTGARDADGSLGKARTGSDKFKTSLDKLKGSADKTKKALQDVKKQSDAVEKSVGKAGKNADKGGKSMGSLGKGLKGASTAQKGLNLAMASNPFGLVMTLLAPLIAQFVNMDKVAALVKKGLTAAWSAIRNSSSSAAKFIGPLFKGVVNGFLTPTRMLVRGLNVLIGGLNHVKFSVPDWVPVIGGKGFAFNLPKIPVPQLAKGGIVQARAGGRLALIGEGGESEAVIPLSRLESMLGHHPGGGAALHRLAQAVERLAERPVQIDVDSQTIARAVLVGQRKLARR
ncbi:hypothetical protein ACIOJD_07610 [Streptomyces sp. NPDC088116]|uniref:hypothetical protein n=1 Tax=Streptomyces sp. NPDC088116 TaxID=3365825 RepID=UPI0038197137